MTVEILILAGMVHLTAPAAAEPQQYAVTSYTLPGAELRYRPFDGLVDWRQCYDRCATIPGQPNQLLKGEYSEAALSALQITFWRRDGDRWVQVMHCNNFFTGPHCGKWGNP